MNNRTGKKAKQQDKPGRFGRAVKRIGSQLRGLGKNGRGDSLPEAQVISSRSHNVSANKVSPAAMRTVEGLRDAGFDAYLVGGCVRDLLLGSTPKDFDVATSASPEQVKDVFGRGCRLIGRRFRLAHVRFGREVIEVATYRGQSATEEDDHATDDAGRIVRDNVFGSIAEDALRRDLTCNALYYDPINETISDFVGGVADLDRRVLKLIGDPEQRYREDPVRMLRVIRFACKLNLEIDGATEAPLKSMAPLLADIPAARLFDEVLKLLQSGYGSDTFVMLREYGLFEPMFPQTEPLLSAVGTPANADLKLLQKAIFNTDQRLQSGKSVTPAFLYAALLWPATRSLQQHIQDDDMAPATALAQAASQVLSIQSQHVTIPKRFSIPMREIWSLQHRFRFRRGNRPFRLLEHPRFRAAYDFLLLRAYAGEVKQEVADWWTEFQVENPAPVHAPPDNRRPRRNNNDSPRNENTDNSGGNNRKSDDNGAENDGDGPKRRRRRGGRRNRRGPRGGGGSSS